MTKRYVTAALAVGALLVAAPPLVAVAGATTNDGEVTGTIVNALNGKPVTGGCFTMWTTSGTFTFFAAPDGSYDATNLPEGYWEASASDCSGKPKYAPVVYDGHPGLDGDQNSVNFVNVLGGGVPTTGIDFVLPKGGTIKVKLTDSVTHKPISGATVCPDAAVLNNSGQPYQTGFCTNTNSKGDAEMRAVVAGTSTMFAFATGYNFAWYTNQPDFAHATQFTVTAGATTKLAMSLAPTG
ncbi:MAG TPA: hypothetical protein VKG43_08855 [Acidimicrobiales bacterium]|nr:hypothetical protein [Acidimicrobiales bacterium]